MSKRSKQFLNQEYVQQTKRASTEEILRFLEEYRQIAAGDEGLTKLISLRVPERVLDLFKVKAKNQNQKYQTLIVRLMRDYLKT